MAAAALAWLAAACARKAEPPGGSGAGKPVIGLVFDVGGRGDKSFNDAADAGLQRAIGDGLVCQENTEFIEADATGYKHLVGKEWEPRIVVTANIFNRAGHRTPDG